MFQVKVFSHEHGDFTLDNFATLEGVRTWIHRVYGPWVCDTFSQFDQLCDSFEKSLEFLGHTGVTGFKTPHFEFFITEGDFGLDEVVDPQPKNLELPYKLVRVDGVSGEISVKRSFELDGLGRYLDKWDVEYGPVAQGIASELVAYDSESTVYLYRGYAQEELVHRGF